MRKNQIEADPSGFFSPAVAFRFRNRTLSGRFLRGALLRLVSSASVGSAFSHRASHVSVSCETCVGMTGTGSVSLPGPRGSMISALMLMFQVRVCYNGPEQKTKCKLRDVVALGRI